MAEGGDPISPQLVSIGALIAYSDGEPGAGVPHGEEDAFGSLRRFGSSNPSTLLPGWVP